MRSLFLRRLLVLFVALLAFGSVLNAQPVSSDIQVPLVGTVFYDLAEELLPLDGLMHVNAQVTSKGAVNVRANMDGVSGIGIETGIRYNAIGRDEATVPFSTSITHDFDFKIIPADGFTFSCILRVSVRLTFSAGGELTGVNIQDLSVIHP